MTSATAASQPARAPFAFGYVLAVLALVGPATALFAPIMVSGLFVAAALAAGWRQYRTGKIFESFRSVPALLFATLILWSSISLKWSIDADLGRDLLRWMVPFLVGTLLVLAASATLDERERRVLGRALAVGFVLGFVLMVIEVWTADGIHQWVYLDLLKHPLLRNGVLDQGAVWLVFIAFPLALAFHRAGRPLLAVLTLLPCGPLAYEAMDYSAGIAGVLGLIVFALVFAGGKPLAIALGILTCIAVLVAPLLPFGPFAPEYWQAILSGVKSTGMQRLYIWEFAAHHIFMHPFHGWGLDTAQVIPGGTAPNPAGGTLLQKHPHNGPLQLWLELGLAGALILTGLIGHVFYRAAMLPDRFQSATIVGLLAAVLVILCTSYGMWQGWWASTLVLMAAFASALVRPAVPSGAGTST